MAQFLVNDATTSAGAASKGQLDTTIAAIAGVVLRQSSTISLANLQGAGSVTASTFNIGAALPANARLIAGEVSVTQALNGAGIVTAVTTVQGSGETAGNIVASADSLTTGLKASVGSNPYLTRGAQQITATITIVGLNLSALTAGSVTVNLFYTIVS